MKNQWQFWIDKGGTFTDLVVKAPNQRIFTHKVLNKKGEDSLLESIEQVIGLPLEQLKAYPVIKDLTFGTTLVTNALLEHNIAPVALLITQGFKDLLSIGNQDRPELFSLNITPYRQLYQCVTEIDERINAQGEVLKALDLKKVSLVLQKLYNEGYRSLAITLLHSTSNPKHEQALKALAKDIGFENAFISSDIPSERFIPRARTTVLDAALSPILSDYLRELEHALPQISIHCMQSCGGLQESLKVTGREMLFSGPTGGLNAARILAKEEGITSALAFDMGGTSTDVSLIDKDLELIYEKEIAGTLLQQALIPIETVASGGGSIVKIVGERLSVGPESAGADPGPCCYRKEGPLTLTDCQVALGRILPDAFPKIFGEGQNLPIDVEAVRRELEELSCELFQSSQKRLTAVEIAEGAMQIAVEKMAHAIQKAVMQKGKDLCQSILIGYGSAQGQYICRIADVLGIQEICIPKLASIFSACGLFQSPIKNVQKTLIEKPLKEEYFSSWDALWEMLEGKALKELESTLDEPFKQPSFKRVVHLKYAQSMHLISVVWSRWKDLKREFEKQQKAHFGFLPEGDEIVVESLSLEAELALNHGSKIPTESFQERPFFHEKLHTMWLQGRWEQVPVYRLNALEKDFFLKGPALLVDSHNTIVLEKGWSFTVGKNKNYRLKKIAGFKPHYLTTPTAEWDPIQLERFHILFQSIAEKMGERLRQSAFSVNIKERLDYSCAIFDHKARLIASAPHIPVHLGSMGESVSAIKEKFSKEWKEGDLFLMNAPFQGGTHLPDLTVVMPIFSSFHKEPFAFVAARGHHADIGGISPGSMPALSQSIEEEGIYIPGMLVVSEGLFLKEKLVEVLQKGAHATRNVKQNVMDIQAQIAACHLGGALLKEAQEGIGEGLLSQYMEYILINAQHEVEKLILNIPEGELTLSMDLGHKIHVHIEPQKKTKRMKISFKGTSPQSKDNFNAPLPILKSVVLYVLRCLIPYDIPLNEGCLWPVQIEISPKTLLSPEYPAAVAAGNVETSQALANALLGALKSQACSQATMNNITFGNEKWQYYETLCGGSGATSEANGCDAVHTHMTNSRLTDPEVFEKKYPIRLLRFELRKGSGGLGHHHGGDGVIREWEFEEDLEVNLITNMRKEKPFGLEGGEAGQSGINIFTPKEKAEKKLSSVCTISVKSGDKLRIETPGGGGYGYEKK